MEVRVLGPVEIVGEEGPVPLGAPMQRRLLSALVIHAGEARSADLLIDAVWGPSPPASAAKVLQMYVSQLRKVMPAPMRIQTHGSGYTLELEDGSLDAARFERLLSEGRDAARAGNPALAASLLRRALRLWRGQAYADFAYEQFAREEAERLEELRMEALEERIEAELALGRHVEVLPELLRIAAGQPARERLRAQAMLALYRCGRQSEALDLYADARTHLLDELGLEPGADLRQLQRQILEQDPMLAAPSPEGTVAHSLPSPPNRLLGRARELAELRELLLRDDVRLLVLTGAGGSGKTRLALEAAREAAPSFANGAVFVDLAPLRDPGLVVGTIANALGLQEGPTKTLAAALGTRELLLLVDNAEHVRAAAPGFVELLALAPRLTMLVTSRVVLHVSGERVYPVEPLPAEPAVVLFLDRAREAEPRFQPDAGEEQAIRRICDRLDGLPLAIELAASRVRTLAPVELLDRLDPRLPLLTGGPRDLPARQQTLRATLAWSYGLLDDEGRRDLAQLAVFTGGCMLEAAEAVCDITPERISSLLDANLLRRAATAKGSRYSMLETIREYASERLEALADAEVVRRRHAEYFLELARSANLASEAPAGGEQRYDVVISEQSNIRAAIDWATETGDVALALELTVALETFWTTSDPFEGVRRLEALLARADDVPLRLRARALRALSGAATQAGDLELAERAIHESLDGFRAIGDELGVGNLLHRLGMNALNRGEPARAREPLEESLAIFRRHGARRGEAINLGGLGYLAQQEGHADQAEAVLEQSAAMAAEEGFTWWEATTRANLAELALAENRLDDAARYARQALRLTARIGDRQLSVYALAYLAIVAAENGDARRAGRLWGAVEAEETRRPVGHWEGERDQYAARLPARSSSEFEIGLREGRQLSLLAAIDEAVDEGDCALAPGKP
ncbi:MAG TPA: BTAD domain-containing putative transcriptional regulator [Gaiellaceae bacterium]|nr:BTAD domain-containing putative transcriptional regulator [Gaiellaceae bacterium]